MTPAERAGHIFAAARAERDAMTPADAARCAVRPGGPSVAEIEQRITAHRRRSVNAV